MRFQRQNAVLNEAIEHLDNKLRECKGNTIEAWSRLNDLELEFVRGEIASCIDSRVYYLENYHIIITETGMLMGMSPLWDHQRMIEDVVQRERERTGQCKVIVLKPRQSGGTEYANGVMCHSTFFTPYAYTMTVAQDPGTSAHVQRKINTAWNYLPWWLRPERQYHTKGEYLEFNRKDEDAKLLGDTGLGSVFVTTHSQRATGVAIGKTIRFLHLTEVSRWASGEIYTADIEPSLNAPDTLAIAESTALGDSGFFYNLWQEAMEGDSDWTPVFLPVYRAKKFSLPLRPQQHPFVLTELEQATKTRVQSEEKFTISSEFFNWRRYRIKSAIKRTGYAYAHYESYPMTPKEAFQSSGHSAFPRHKLDEQSQSRVMRPSWIGEVVYQGKNASPKLLGDIVGFDTPIEKREFTKRLHIWEQPKYSSAYYVSVDVGGIKIGDDFTVIEVLRAGVMVLPDVQAAEWVGYGPASEIAKIAYALGKMYNNAEIAVEYAKEGITTANYLTNDLEYPNLYRPRALDRIGNQMANYLHWQTNQKTKHLIVTGMAESLLEDSIIIRSAYAMSEMYKFSKDGQGYSGLGSHDDAAMSLCIGQFCLRQTLTELRAPQDSDDAANLSPTASARMTGGGIIFGIYDEFTRMRGQSRDMQYAFDVISAHPGWQMKPIVVSKVNTAYSPIYHGRGAENRLLREGMESRDILPNVLQVYRGAQPPSAERPQQDLDAMVAGDDIWGGMDD